MNHKLKLPIFIFIMALSSFLLIYYHSGYSFHTYIVQVNYIVILIVAAWYKKFLIPAVFYLTAIHVISEAVYIQSWPNVAFTESFVQILVSIAIYIVINRNDKTSESLKNLIEATHVGTWEWNVQTGACVFNQRWAEICGYTLEELAPISIKTWIDLLHPEDNEISNQRLSEVFDRKKDFYDTKIRMKHKDGNWVWVHDRGKVIKWTTEEKPLIMSGTHTEITHEIEMQKSLEHSYDLMRYVIEHDKSAIAVFDDEMNYVYVSDKYMVDHKVKHNHIIGKNHYDVFPYLPKALKEIHQRALKGEVLSNDRQIIKRDDGTIDYTRWECRPWYSKDDSIGGMILYTEIISDQIKKEKELEESKNLLESMIDSIPVGLAVNEVFPDVKNIYMNDKFAQIYGTTKEKLEEVNAFWDVVYENESYREEIKKRVLEDLESGDPNRTTWENIPLEKDGKVFRYISAYNSKLNDTTYVSSVLDVTDQVMRQKEIERISYIDHLTGLYNRRFFTKKLSEYDQPKFYPLGVLMADLNGLKIINDAYGHQTGDEALKKISDLLKNSINSSSIVARIGGDEFAFLFPNCNKEEIEKTKDRIKKLSSQISIQNLHLSIAMGYHIKENISDDILEVMKYAENDMYKHKISEGMSVRNHAIKAILNTLTDKFEEEKIHSLKVSSLCKSIGKALHIKGDDLVELELAGLYHDIGKISIPDSILNKPGKLTEEEFEVIKTHTEVGYQILRAADEYSDLAEHALSHHERWDGNGYPRGLKAEQIPLFSRIISIADSYEAMTADRPYRKAMNQEKAIEEIIRCSGSQFDPKIANIFINDVLKYNKHKKT
ncbi:HD domain-containing phosphohydrolase [Peloplasma aerotolerans]|uniref:Diguanylate cyclase n=1 Tax=Peloplasma aerotolerans TaxID=3044389 RepID=A0AAW6UBW0_9MOLU|nr:HD domain-containing phosphohydrolase [Mariniplasma sp. M4Ah]MDI6453633.1 diguanylate cyclase [Mariniplasma sp. M4Ah]